MDLVRIQYLISNALLIYQIKFIFVQNIRTLLLNIYTDLNFIMGAGQNKDKNINIFVETSKPLYTAGQFIEGSIHINCLAPSPYHGLYLKFSCHENVHWSESNGQDSTDYNNKAIPYEQILPIQDFSYQVIPQGHYTFPFKFLLPQGLSGSCYLSDSNFIRYFLKAQLTPVSLPNNKVYPQIDEKVVNIMEPMRLPLGGIQGQRVANPKCCGCCADYGTVTVDLQCDKNFLRPGDHFNVNIMIDNTQGNKDAENIAMSLKQNIILISQEGRQRNEYPKTSNLLTLDKKFNAYSKQNFCFSGKVPFDFSDQTTAIGTVIANTCCIQLNFSMGCCSVPADSKIHMFYQSSRQRLQEPEVRPLPPANWKPYIYATKIFTDLKPYIYMPSPYIPLHNRDQTMQQLQNVNNLQNMGNPYPRNNQSNNNSLSYVQPGYEVNSNSKIANYEDKGGQ